MKTIDMTKTNYKRWITILTLILIVGLLIYSITILISYTFLAPSGVFAKLQSIELIEQRMNLRMVGEKIQQLCAALFYIGGILLTYTFVKTGLIVEFKKLIFLFGKIILATLACATIFSMLDSKSAGDYFFPVWSILSYTIIFFVVVTISNFIKKRRIRRKVRMPL